MNSDSFFASLGLAGDMPPLPEEVWERTLSIALDPTTPPADAELVPEQDDIPVHPSDDGIVLFDDSDDDSSDSDDGSGDARDAVSTGHSVTDGHDLLHGGSVDTYDTHLVEDVPVLDHGEEQPDHTHHHQGDHGDHPLDLGDMDELY